MFREDSHIDTASVSPAAWHVAVPAAIPAPAPQSALAAAFADEEAGAVAHLYREIAQRIPRNAFTPHASTLGEALR